MHLILLLHCAHSFYAFISQTHLHFISSSKCGVIRFRLCNQKRPRVHDCVLLLRDDQLPEKASFSLDFSSNGFGGWELLIGTAAFLQWIWWFGNTDWNRSFPK